MGLSLVSTTLLLSLASSAAGPTVSTAAVAGEAVLVKDLEPGPGDGSPRFLTAVGDRLLFAVRDDSRSHLWTTDGSTAGTRRLYDDSIDSASRFLVPDGERAFLWLWEPGPEIEPGVPNLVQNLWRSDGTSAGTARVTQGVGFDVVGSFWQPSTWWVPGLERLFFRGSSAEVTEELWATDGSPAGTGLVKDLHPGPTFPGRMVDLGDVLYFTALVADEESQAEGRLPRRVGRSDGTAAGTFFLDGPAADELEAVRLAVAGNRVIAFLWSRSHDRISLWSARKGDDELVFVADVGEWEEDDLRLLLRSADRVFFAFASSQEGPPGSLWASDGTAAGTGVVAEWSPSDLEKIPQWHLFVEPHSGGVALPGFDSERGVELWLSDGTPGGTGPVADVCPGPCGGGAVLYGEIGGSLIFWANDPQHGGELRRWSPSAEGVDLVGDLCPGECSGARFHAPVVHDDRLYFVATDGGPLGDEVWVTAGTAASTRRLTDFAPADAFDPRGSFSEAEDYELGAVAGGRLFFRADDGVHGRELWAVPVEGPSADPPPPDDPPITSPQLPGFRAWTRISQPGDGAIPGRAEAACIAETLCVSGALPGRSELFVRIVGPKPNGRLWPTMVKFSTSTIEVWLEQLATGIVRYYRLEGASPGSSDLSGQFDRDGFPPS